MFPYANKIPLKMLQNVERRDNISLIQWVQEWRGEGQNPPPLFDVLVEESNRSWERPNKTFDGGELISSSVFKDLPHHFIHLPCKIDGTWLLVAIIWSSFAWSWRSIPDRLQKWLQWSHLCSHPFHSAVWVGFLLSTFAAELFISVLNTKPHRFNRALVAHQISVRSSVLFSLNSILSIIILFLLISKTPRVQISSIRRFIEPWRRAKMWCHCTLKGSKFSKLSFLAIVGPAGKPTQLESLDSELFRLR